MPSRFLQNISLAVLSLQSFDCVRSPETVPSTSTTVSIATPTIQCDMCVEAITTAVKALPGVDSVGVDLNTKVTVVRFSPSSLTQTEVEESIAKAGYDANGKARDPRAHEDLPACCQVPSEDAAKNSGT